MQRAGGVVVLAAGLLLLLAPTSPAATRYAAPGGTGKDPCANPERPCPVYTAADKAAPGSTIESGDVVELAPGTYRVEEEGEFGEIAGVVLPAGVTVRGEPGKKRPLIIVRANETGYGAFFVPAGSEVADMEIRNESGHGAAIDVAGGTIERVIARSDSGEPACSFGEGTVSDSACIGSGGSPAIGTNLATKGSLEGVIRNSTLIATGPGSVGMEFIYHAFKRGLTVHIDAAGVLLEGEENDAAVDALALDKGRGADVEIDFRNSSYETVETATDNGGRAAVTRPGTGGNITASPLLARDFLHQLPGSPTIDKGPVDSAGGPSDLDGEPRMLGGAPDIGADEFGSFPAQANSAPVTKLVRPAKKGLVLTPLRTIKFIFGSSDLDSRFECKLDRRPYRACTSPYKVRIGLGRHQFRVRAVDPQGLVDATPASLRLRALPWRRFF